MMNLLNLDFLLVIGAETRGKEVRGMVRQDGGFDRLPTAAGISRITFADRSPEIR